MIKVPRRNLCKAHIVYAISRQETALYFEFVPNLEHELPCLIEQPLSTRQLNPSLDTKEIRA